MYERHVLCGPFTCHFLMPWYGYVMHVLPVCYVVFMLCLWDIVKPCIDKYYASKLRGVHGPGWVGLRDFFDPTLYSGWVSSCQIFFKFYLSTIYNYSDTILDKIY